jgi:hypothetical protein
MAPAGERAGERGSVAIVVGLALTLLLGFAALVDVGLSWAVRVDCSCWREGEAPAGPHPRHVSAS